MITKLDIKNFTVFNDLTIDFSPKINVIIGENGTGKTHLLKVAYGLCSGSTLFKSKPDIGKDDIETALTAKLLRLFMPLDDKLGKMRRQGVAENAQLEAQFALDKKIGVSFHTNSKSLAIQENVNYEQYQSEPVFIPTKEVLSLVKGMVLDGHHLPTIKCIFDDTYIDLSLLLMNSDGEDSDGRIDLDPRFGSVVPAMVNAVGGKYQLTGGEFCFQNGAYLEKKAPLRSQGHQAQMYQDNVKTTFNPTKDPMFPSSMTAEGFRKVGILHRLLVNKSLNPGASGPLFWDEPESNMNPKLMKLLVQILLELSRNGQQIILATHDYVLLKWFDLLMDKSKSDHIAFHSLYREKGTDEVKIETTDAFSHISKNTISDTFAELYDEDLIRALG